VRAIPYAGAAGLARLALRTLAVRLALWIGLAALVLAAAVEARHPQRTAPPLLPARAGGIVVLDLSASITPDTYSRIHQTLQQLVARGGSYGLVVFSGTAYEALPPGTPASALASIVRYFVVPNAQPGEQPSLPANPWAAAGFTSGTEISDGLDLARRIELANGVRRPAVVLISDLQDDPNDLERLTAVLGEYHVEKASLRVIALNADPNDLARFRGLIDTASSIIPAAVSGPSPAASPHTRFPILLVVLAGAVALLLGAVELTAAKLDWSDAAAEAAR
jgi:hypothetical protein